MPPKLDEKRAFFVLAKVDEILAWEKRVQNKRDTLFVELGRYLCEIRAGQYWRVEKLTSFEVIGFAPRLPASSLWDYAKKGF